MQHICIRKKTRITRGALVAFIPTTGDLNFNERRKLYSSVVTGQSLGTLVKASSSPNNLFTHVAHHRRCRSHKHDPVIRSLFLELFETHQHQMPSSIFHNFPDNTLTFIPIESSQFLSSHAAYIDNALDFLTNLYLYPSLKQTSSKEKRKKENKRHTPIVHTYAKGNKVNNVSPSIALYGLTSDKASSA